LERRVLCFIVTEGAAQIVGLVAFFRYLAKISEFFRVWFYGSFPCLHQTGLSFPVDEKKAKISLNHTFLTQANASPPVIEQGQRFLFGSDLSIIQNIFIFLYATFWDTPVTDAIFIKEKNYALGTNFLKWWFTTNYAFHKYSKNKLKFIFHF